MATVVLTDRAWPDDRIERGVIESAGHELVAGPAVAGDAATIAALVGKHRPDAVMTCFAPVSAAAIAAAPTLRIVARMGVGLDNIAVDVAARAGAWVTNVPDYCVEEVSDHVLAFIFSWARGVTAFDRAVKAGTWSPSGPRLLRLRDLVVGIVGFGRIGRTTARKLGALGIRVIAHATSPATHGLPVEIVPLPVLLRDSDAVVVHLPLTASTRHFADHAFFSAMKRGALFVNVSRGPIVDSAALLAALTSGQLSGAGLDVVEGEPHPPAELIGHPNVIATPHVAFSSTTSVAELRRRAAEEVVRVLGGAAPEFPCNSPAGRSSDV
jgi:D-3-phosphoglycerate dehydrogenase